MHHILITDAPHGFGGTELISKTDLDLIMKLILLLLSVVILDCRSSLDLLDGSWVCSDGF